MEKSHCIELSIQDKVEIYEKFTIPNLSKLIIKLKNHTSLDGEDREIIKQISNKYEEKHQLEDEKEAFKIVSAFIKKYYPFRHGKKWDKKNGNIDFILGGHALEEWIDYFADDEVDIEAFKKEIEK